MADTPINENTTDADAWAAAYLKALAHDPDIVGTHEGTASWFAAAIDAGRRDFATDLAAWVVHGDN